jgi:hypothetical protein
MLQLSWAKTLWDLWNLPMKEWYSSRWWSSVFCVERCYIGAWMRRPLRPSLIWMRNSIVYTMSWWPEESGGGGETLVLIHFLLVYNPTPWPNCATVTVVILCAHFSHLWLAVVQHHGSKSWVTFVRHRGSLVFSWLGKHAWCIWSERDIVSRSIPRYIGSM